MRRLIAMIVVCAGLACTENQASAWPRYYRRPYYRGPYYGRYYAPPPRYYGNPGPYYYYGPPVIITGPRGNGVQVYGPNGSVRFGRVGVRW